MQETLEKEYEALLGMFNSEGWKIFHKERTELLEAAKETAHNTCITNDDWQFRRGVIFALEQVVNYPAYTEAVREQQELEENAPL
jgi:hypothetical protein